jgi:hypothetical protein
MARKENRYIVDEKTGCWNWLLWKNPNGVGFDYINGKRYIAYKAAYIREYGKIPKNNFVTHLCSNTSCVNVKHLKLISKTEFYENEKKRLFKKVRYVKDRNSGCWNWSLFKGNGYGRLQIKGRTYLAHRYTYEKSLGRIRKGFYLHHKCENPSCVNPLHMMIMRPKAHARIGKNIKLDVKKALIVRQMIADGVQQKDIAIKFRVNKVTICDIHHKITWT